MFEKKNIKLNIFVQQLSRIWAFNLVHTRSSHCLCKFPVLPLSIFPPPSRFHEAIGKHYFDGGYGEGDVIGCLIVLPEKPGHDYLPPCYKDKPLIKYKSHFYYEEKNRIKEATKALAPLKGSKIVFFKNGECMGEAFADLYEGDYIPSFSGYKCPKLKLNFGPKFRYPPSKGGAYKQYRPMSARADQAAIEQSLADMRFFTEREGKLSLNDYFMSP